ncbi:MAG: arginine decarboxylase, partial [Gammaproteobacteria bacterium]|nr:arginine decarboxylase [Gammaproteobacteria bacterium]
MENTARNLTLSSHWKIEDSIELYGVNAWGNGYFGINEAGHVIVRPDQTADHAIDLLEVIHGLEARDLTTPVVVRFSDILRHRLKRLHDAFATAIAENEYRNRYAAVFPIKVNQQRLVVEEVYGYGREFGFGLEVGSKPELLAV